MAPLTLKPSPRARVMRLRVDGRTGAVVLTYPPRLSQRRVLKWAWEQRSWVEDALSRVPAPVAIAPGTMVPLYGIPHRIDWREEASRVIKAEGGMILAGGPLGGLEARILRYLRRRALEVLDRETREFAALAAVAVTKVGVGDPLSRWGSCSSSGAIRYSWRLILAPEFVRRATVAHEVAHRVHMNHGARFHALVETLLGTDPAPARAWLCREGALLHRFGRLR